MTEKDKLYADKLKERALSDYERLDRAINELEQQSSYNSIKTELKLSGDCISREEALKVMCDKCPMYNCVTGCSSYRHIEKMPSVQPQPKRGKWIKYNVDIAPHPLHCSECGWSNHHLNRTIVSDFKHCPNCGADMRGEKV